MMHLVLLAALLLVLVTRASELELQVDNCASASPTGGFAGTPYECYCWAQQFFKSAGFHGKVTYMYKFSISIILRYRKSYPKAARVDLRFPNSFGRRADIDVLSVLNLKASLEVHSPTQT